MPHFHGVHPNPKPFPKEAAMGKVATVIESAIREYGRTNDDPLWREREAKLVEQRLRMAGLLKED